MEDSRNQFIAQINAISPLTFLLYIVGYDPLTIFVFFAMFIMMVFYFSYVGLLTYLKNYQKFIYTSKMRYIRSINQVLNIFFTFYWWIFFTPFIEINAGVIVCKRGGFLVAYRSEENCDSKPLYQSVIGYIGIALSLLTGGIIIIFFRNYEFGD